MHTTVKPTAAIQKQLDALRKHALAYPHTHEDFPWGHSACKVKNKAFVFLHAEGTNLSLSVKLPESNSLALQLPFAEPTGYGLGKSGWVSARFTQDDEIPLAILKSWIDESFHAVAPKTLLKSLAVGDGATLQKAEKKSAKKKSAKKAPAKTGAKKLPAKKSVKKLPAEKRRAQ